MSRRRVATGAYTNLEVPVRPADSLFVLELHRYKNKMPISYSIDVERSLILSRWEGLVTAGDVAAHWKRLFSDERALAIGRSLTDLRGADLRFSADDIRHLTDEIVRPLLDKGPWKTAMVVDQPKVFVISRRLQIHAEMLDSSRIFTDEPAALAWLLAK
jgi:hypothetical protein